MHFGLLLCLITTAFLLPPRHGRRRISVPISRVGHEAFQVDSCLFHRFRLFYRLASDRSSISKTSSDMTTDASVALNPLRSLPKRSSNATPVPTRSQISSPPCLFAHRPVACQSHACPRLDEEVLAWSGVSESFRGFLHSPKPPLDMLSISNG